MYSHELLIIGLNSLMMVKKLVHIFEIYQSVLMQFSVMLDKLSKYVIRNVELYWFKDYIKDLAQMVSYNNCCSDIEHLSLSLVQKSHK
jgi:hypothetical protein